MATANDLINGPKKVDTDSNQLSAQISIAACFQVLRSNLKLLAGFFIMGILIGIIQLTQARPVFLVSTTLKARQSTEVNTGALGALLDLNSSQSDQSFEEFKFGLKTTSTAKRLNEKYSLNKEVFASRWDEETETWQYPEGLSGFKVKLKNFVRKAVQLPVRMSPTNAQLKEYYESKLKISDSANSFLTIEFLHYTPDTGIRHLDLLVKEVDLQIRERKTISLQNEYDYLTAELQKTTMSESRNALIKLLQFRQEELMLIASNELYSAVWIERVHSSEMPVSPSIKAYILGYTIGITFLGILWVLFRARARIITYSSRK